MLYNRGRELGKLIIQLAPTGIVPTKETNPSVPIFPDEIVRETYEAYLLGVSSVHIHARDPAGNPTGRGEIYEEIISGIRKNCPGIIICASTTGRIHDGPRDGSLDCNPDLASLMMGSVMFRSSLSVNTFEQISCLAKKMREKKLSLSSKFLNQGLLILPFILRRKGF